MNDKVLSLLAGNNILDRTENAKRQRSDTVLRKIMQDKQNEPDCVLRVLKSVL
jgi:hypothetical protein